MVEVWDGFQVGMTYFTKEFAKKRSNGGWEEEHSYSRDDWIVLGTGLPDLQGPFQAQEDSRRQSIIIYLIQQREFV